MALEDRKIEIRKRNTDFDAGGYRLLPVTKPLYIEGLLDANEKIKMEWMPESVIGINTCLGAVNANTLVDLDDLLGLAGGTAAIGKWYAISVAGSIADGATVAVWAPGAADVDGGTSDPGPSITLEPGDRMIVTDYNDSNIYEIAVLPATYQAASTIQAGIVKLNNTVNSDSTVEAATAAAVKSAYVLANGKEPAIGAKGTAFNKNFGTALNDVAQGNHNHDSAYEAADAAIQTHLAADAKHRLISDGSYAADILWSGYYIDQVLGGYSATGHAHATLYEPKKTNIQTHIGDATKHRVISDGSVAATDLWSGYYIDQALGGITVGIASVNGLTAALKEGLKSYDTVALADAGGHAANDIVIIDVT